MARVLRYADPAIFWREARAFLERDEAGNTHLLANASRLAAEPGDEAPTGYLLTEGDETCAAALLTARGSLFLTPAAEPALATLCDTIVDAAVAVTDIIAEQATAESYARIAGIPVAVHVGLRLYRLDAVSPPPTVPGAMRQANDDDFDLLCEWQRAFFAEIGARNPAEEGPEIVRRRLQLRGGWIWDVDGVPVAHAGHRATPVRSARIAPVYTPPGERGHGYASALVAALSQHLLAMGQRPLYLFADTLNPTSNGVYLRVGFHPVALHLHLVRDNRGQTRIADAAPTPTRADP